MHVLAIRTFTESILRYGLPPAYLAVVIQPANKQEARLRAVLASTFGDGRLGGGGGLASTFGDGRLGGGRVLASTFGTVGGWDSSGVGGSCLLPPLWN